MTALNNLIQGLDSQDTVDALDAFIMSGEGTSEDRKAALDLRTKILDQELAAAVERMEGRTGEFMNFIERLDRIIINLPPDAASVFDNILGRAGNAFLEVHDKFALRSAFSSASEAQAEANKPTDTVANPIGTNPEPPAAPPSLPVIGKQPIPINSKDYSKLREEYVRFFFGGYIRDEHLAEVRRNVGRAIKNKARYETVGEPLGIPWWFIAGLHMMESGFNFRTHLHNGDSLDGRTHRVPPGRPVAAPANGVSYSWEESAIDALRLKKLNREDNWSLSRTLYRWEKYNGWGYRGNGVPSAYLWSYSSVYKRGKYIRDGVFDPNAISKQCGAAVFLKYLYKSGEVTLYDDENEQLLNPVFGGEAVPSQDPAPVSHLPEFDEFLRQKVPGLVNFTPSEFLVKGGQHNNSTDRCFNLNADPPRNLWDNVVPLAEVLQEFRTRINAEVRLLNVYRARPYNECIGGAPESHHMLFHAADFVVLNNGTRPVDWARILDSMRTTEGIFKGGLKAYRTFVHVDTRGKNANW